MTEPEAIDAMLAVPQVRAWIAEALALKRAYDALVAAGEAEDLRDAQHE